MHIRQIEISNPEIIVSSIFVLLLFLINLYLHYIESKLLRNVYSNFNLTWSTYSFFCLFISQ